MQNKFYKDTRFIIVLLRFIRDLKISGKLITVTIVFTFIGSSLPIVVMWLLGTASKCENNINCIASINFFDYFTLGFSITLSLLFTLFLISLITRFLSLVGIEIIGMWSTRRIHKRLIDKLNSVRVTFFDEKSTGKLINRIISDYAYIRIRGIGYIADFMNAISELIVIVCILAIANPVLSLTILPVTLLYFYLQLNISSMSGYISELSSRYSGELLHSETALIEGKNIHKIYNRENYLFSEIRKTYRRVIDLQLVSTKITVWGFFFMTLISTIFLIIVYSYVIYALSINTIGKIFARVIISVLFTLENSVMWLTRTIPNLNNASTIIRRLYQIIDLPTELSQELKNSNVNSTDASCDNNAIVFQNVSMSYKENSSVVLKNINLKIKMGEVTGFVGRTGAGEK